MRFLLLYVLLSVASITSSAQSGDLRLWYRQPAGATWENALPIGNGRLGAMIYGNVEKEIIQLNEHTLWSGSPNRNDNPDAHAALPALRQLIFDGRQKEAETLANKVIISKTSHGQMFVPLGNLELTFEGHEKFSNYYRELDLETAVTKTVYEVAGVKYQRQALASLAGRVIAIHLTASKAKSISFSAAYAPALAKSAIHVSGNDLVIAGTVPDHEGVEGKVRYQGITRILPQGGTVSRSDTSLVIRGADAVTIYISVATNFNAYNDIGGDEHKRAITYLDEGSKKTFGRILADHVKAYKHYFNRVKLDLGNAVASALPTDERLKNFSTANDPQFVELYFQFGRYLLISSSQPGGQPANLQGIWNNKVKPPWDSKYTININAQMNYWPAEKTNLPELHEPFLRMVQELAITGRETARGMYGARGWMAHHNTDIWRVTGAVDGAFWGSWSGSGGWMSLHLWDHYLYNGDKQYLESVYPALKGAAMFYVDYMVEHPTKHWLVVNPDMSPENAPAAHQGSSLDAGTTMTNQIIFDIFSTVIKASEVLGADAAFADTLQRLRDRLPPMHIGKHGQLQEWLEDIDDPRDHHRHVSHLYGLFPSNQISPYRTPQLYSAARNTLQQRGDVSTGWSMGWKVNWWARLLDGNHAYKLIKDQLTPVGVNEAGGGTYNNLFDAHPPFQIDGNFGCTSGIVEMLMQSADCAVHLLPALPDEWPAGRVSGLRAPGGFEIVDMQWDSGKLSRVVVKSALGGNLRMRCPNKMKLENGNELTPAAGDNSNLFYTVAATPAAVVSAEATITPPQLSETWLYDVGTKPGQTYTFARFQ